MLYHGSIHGGLDVIQANSKSHTTGETVVYFTEDRCYALVCCRDRSSNFVTMGLKSDGKQHYFERFPEQLKTMYSGKRGYLYTLKTTDGLTNTNGHTWESNVDIPVCECQVIEDVYMELLREETEGNLVIHRYTEIDPAEQKAHANHIKEHLDDWDAEMQLFYMTHFSSLWD